MAGERILVVDDEPGVRSALEGILADEGFIVRTAGSGEEGLRALEQESCDAVLLDVWLPGMDGLEALQRIRQRADEVEVVMISGHGTIETAVRATKLGAFDFVEKPLSLDKILLVLRNALRQRRLEQRNRHLLAQLARETDVVGRSAAAEQLRREIEVAAESDAPVLIRGEPGSGREQVARRIHASSPRADGAFVEIPCGALDADSAEQALYGPARRVVFAAAGSLFLEEIDRLSGVLQQRLAGSLEGGEQPWQEARLIASMGTDAALLAPVLRAQLEVIRISVPALRERREDIPALAERFMLDLSREYGRQPKRLSPDCMGALMAHGWPGNIRELRNVMERLLLVTAGETAELGDLPDELGGARVPAEDLYRAFGSLAEGLEAFERYYITRILVEEDGDHEAAARRLGLSTSVFRERLRALH